MTMTWSAMLTVENRCDTRTVTAPVRAAACRACRAKFSKRSCSACGSSDDPVLRSISAQLPAGSVVGLVGINGAGKSTTVKLLTGLYRPTSGRILVDGQPLTGIDPGSWAA